MSEDKNYLPDLVFHRIADKRVKDWPLMNNPHKLIVLSIFYLLAIYVVLPRYMKKKQPYELKTFMKFYNIFQVVTNFLLAYNLISLNWTGWDSLGCKPMVYSEDKARMQTANLFWWNMVLKSIEFIETIIFALRKKNNQISILHVYHHISTLAMGWMSCKYLAGEMASFDIIMNSSVHVLMYSYYFLTSLGPEMQKKLTFIKSKLTIIQVVQLIFLFLHDVQMASPNCNIHFSIPLVILPSLAINIALFLNFYRKAYINKKIK